MNEIRYTVYYEDGSLVDGHPYEDAEDADRQAFLITWADGRATYVMLTIDGIDDTVWSEHEVYVQEFRDELEEALTSD